MGLVAFGSSPVHSFDWQPEQLLQTLILMAHQLFKKLSMVSDIANERHFYTTIILTYQAD